MKRKANRTETQKSEPTQSYIPV